MMQKTIFIDTSQPAQIYLTAMGLMKFLVDHLKNWILRTSSWLIWVNMVSLTAEPQNISNRRLVLQIIRDAGPLSRAEIARRLHLSRPTASRIIDTLEQAGFITRTGKSLPTGGRLGELYSFREDAGFVLGLELGTREARIAIANLNGEIVTRAARILQLEARDSVLPQISHFVNDTLDHFSEPSAKVLALGVAVPGIVHSTPEAGAGYIDAAKVFQGLNDRPLQRELEHLFHLPVAMENDVNLAAIGESQFGCAQGQKNVVYLFVGRGIGAGLILDEKLFRGNTEAAGEVGNMVVDRPHLYQTFGTRGCLEALASIDQIVTASKAPEAAETSDGHDISVEAFCRQALAGEPHAHATIHAIVEYLAVAIINLVAVIDPGIVVFGGDLSELPYADELFVQPIAQFMKRHTGDNPQLRLSQLKGDASLYGAVQAAISEVLNTTQIPAAEPNGRVEI